MLKEHVHTTVLPNEALFFVYYKVSSTNMEGLRELRGMVIFPAEETTRGCSCYSGDYAD